MNELRRTFESADKMSAESTAINPSTCVTLNNQIQGHFRSIKQRDLADEIKVMSRVRADTKQSHSLEVA